MMYLSDLPKHWGYEIGCLVIPPKATPDVLKKYVRPLIMMTESAPDFPALRGSATLFRYMNKTYAAITKHQFSVDDTNLESAIDWLSVARLRADLTSIKLTKLILSVEQGFEFSDICIFETEIDDTLFDESSYFSLTDPTREKSPILKSLVYGFGQDLSKIDYNQNMHVTLAPVGGMCFQVEPYFSQEFCRSYKLESPFEIPPDGLSGGAVFHLRHNGDIGSVSLDAIITRAGVEYVHGIGAEFIVGAITENRRTI